MNYFPSIQGQGHVGQGQVNLLDDEEVPEDEVEDTLGNLQPTSTLIHHHLAPHAPPVNPLWRSTNINIEFPSDIN